MDSRAPLEAEARREQTGHQVSRDSAVQGPSSLDSKDLPDQLDHVDVSAQQVCNSVFAVTGAK